MCKSVNQICALMWRINCLALLLVLTLTFGTSMAALAQNKNANKKQPVQLIDFAAIGRSASTNEIAAWDNDVRPDWQGLPPGSGSVAQGQEVWDQQCSSCHGTFGEANQVFTPIVGGTTQADITTGRVAALANNSQPQRTTLMKLATLSTLWDYIRRAMPWNAPKTLSNDQVYAVTAYILNLGDIVPDNFVLNQENIQQIQLPNRKGLSLAHGLWQVEGKADVVNVACMHNCPGSALISSALPEIARNTHGNLALQNRSFGAVRGVDTAVAATGATTNQSNSAAALASQYGCLACHHPQQTSIGPSFTRIASKYPNDAATLARLMRKLKQGGAGVWGEVPMPPQGQVRDEDLQNLLQWLLEGAK